MKKAKDITAILQKYVGKEGISSINPRRIISCEDVIDIFCSNIETIPSEFMRKVEKEAQPFSVVWIRKILG